MTSYQHPADPNHDRSSHLSRKHRKILYEESGIDPGVCERAGVYSVRRGKDVPQESGWLPSRPGIAFPTHTLGNSDDTFPRMRYDAPGKGPKYRQPAGVANRLYVHPDQHEQIMKPGRARFVVEGEKKTLAGVSRGLLVVGLSGVWNGQKNKALIPDWDLLPLDDEIYVICFDSDITDNPNVADAAERQARLLQERGATVYMTVLPHAPDGSKQGLDDFFVNGGTVKELRMLTRKYEPGMIGRVRLSRDERLRYGVELLERRFWGFAWGAVVGASESGRPNSMRGHGCRDVVRVLIDEARQRGKSCEDGVKVAISTRTLALKAATSRQTVMKCIRHLIAEDWLTPKYPKEREQAASYVLHVPRANLDQYGKEQRVREQATEELQVVLVRGKGLRASPKTPRLRWSSPGRKAKRGTVEGTRKVRDSRQPAVPGYRRLGKIRGAILDALDTAGGQATIQEIAKALQRSRPRDLRRRNLPMLESDGLITVDGDLVTLADSWLQRLDEVREVAGELDARDRDAKRNRIQREAFRKASSSKDTPVTPHWTQTPEADGSIEDLQKPPDELDLEDRHVLDAIESFERKYGRGSFKWNQSGAKELFYSIKPGVWPLPDQLQRIEFHLISRRTEAA